MTLSAETKCIHLAERIERTATDCCTTKESNPSPHYGAVSFPIYQTATYTHPEVGQSTGFDYSRLQNPTRAQVEKIVAQLEGGIDAFALSSGMAAITLLMEIFKPGDHLIIDNDLYGGSIRLFDAVSAKNGIRFTRADISTDSIEPLFTDSTRAVYVETPTNPMMHVTDIAKLASICRAHGVILIVDNTFLSPYFQNPLALGADIVIHSGTKFLGGHNDTLAGFLVTKSADIQEQLRYLIKTTGAGLAPFDCWLILRGIKTLALRMERSQENAQKIALWLKKHPLVKRVLYPGLPEHPGYRIMQKQARGFGSMLTFEVKDSETAKRILKSVKLIQFAESLGGVETLITYPITQTHAEVPESLRLKNGITESVLRLSVGIENSDDLIADLAQAFSQE
ncbi:trans-sulfuration enzyme family protein [Treponema zioleckii]|uniref:trans-sulfuration enzyme family protein n=1 Tax=Treponema zioleckii TaxID=331680 RepID=UPI00168BDBFA|nr:PLP-dependent aspartate aminotransferase family protein [Treponema zioleckii]